MKKNFWQSLWIVIISNISSKYIVVNEPFRKRYFIEEEINRFHYTFISDRCLECNLRFINNCSYIPCLPSKRFNKKDERILIYKELVLWK